MKLLSGPSIILLGSWITQVLSLGTLGDVAVVERAHSREIVKRAGRDCGIFQMDCVAAAGACNNACYYKNCINPNGYKMVYDAANTNDQNRAQSGCIVGLNGPSICNQLPFSQVFHDPQNKIPGDISITCDEWPMATTKQADFAPGTVRNSLRCMPQSENGSGGGQLSAWLTGDNTSGPKKTCPSPMQDGDFWTFQPGLTGASPVLAKNCFNPSCGADPLQFIMTAKVGSIGVPYVPSTSNRYKQDGKPTDLLQCRVDVKRTGDKAFSILVYDGTGTQKGKADISAFANTGSFPVTGLPSTLTFQKLGPFAASGAGMGFVYNSSPTFSWLSDQTGSSLKYQPDGKYCSVVSTATAQDLNCYFPCPA